MSWSLLKAGKAGEVLEAVKADTSSGMEDEFKQALISPLLKVKPDRNVVVETSGHVDANSVTVDVRIRSSF